MNSVQSVCNRLSHMLGPFPCRRERNPLDTLIRTILSQNTSDINSHRAFQRLKRAFPTWEKAHRAPRWKIQAAISCAGLGKIKSLRIKQVLAALANNNGKPSLERIRTMRTPQARQFLCSLPGVGMKTACCVLLFALGRPVCPVDTHVLRTARRIGLIAPELTAEKATLALEKVVPKDAMLAFHLGLIKIGRTTCRPRSPRHEKCVIRDLCAFAKRT